MGRGRMVSGGGSRGGSVSSGGSRGRSSFGGGHNRGGFHHHTTVIVGGGHHGVHYQGGSPIVGIVVGAIFVLVGFFIMFSGLTSCAVKNEFAIVQAECVDNQFAQGGYFAIYEYTVDEVDYRNTSNQSWEEPEIIGKIVTIYYLESDPNQIYERKPNEDNGEGGVLILVGLICAGLGALPLVLCIKELKKKTQNIAGGETTQTAKEETYNRCPYCGSKYSKSSDSCPKCGASKMD